jgi:1-aminocyclopropane-1-carboxylate deaminase
MVNLSKSTIHSVEWELASASSISVDIKRDDLIHSIVSGNKWRKLKYLIEDAQNKGCERLISMGGNWSNHLHALAYAGKQFGMTTEAFVRAHPEQPITATLKDCKHWDMKLRFTSRKEYAALREKSAWNEFHKTIPDSYWIVEGGYSELAIRGVKDMRPEVEVEYDYIFVGCGSGATLCGLVKAFPKSQIVGVAAFSGAEYLQQTLSHYLGHADNWRLDTEHHCGGFAKSSNDLERLQSQLEADNCFQLDRVYNAKTFLALQTAIMKERIPKNSKVLVLHTGGLQGNRELKSSVHKSSS